MFVFTALSSSFRQARGPHNFAFHNYLALVKCFGNSTEDNTDEFEDLHVSEDTAVFDPASTTTTVFWATHLQGRRPPNLLTWQGANPENGPWAIFQNSALRVVLAANPENSFQPASQR